MSLPVWFQDEESCEFTYSARIIPVDTGLFPSDRWRYLFQSVVNKNHVEEVRMVLFLDTGVRSVSVMRTCKS